MKHRQKHAVGARLQQVRQALSMNRKQFAALLLVSRNTVHQNETGVTFPRLQLLQILAVDKGVSLEWLLCGTGEMFPKPPDVSDDITAFMAKNEAVTELVAAMKDDRRLLFHILSTMENYKKEKD